MKLFSISKKLLAVLACFIMLFSAIIPLGTVNVSADTPALDIIFAIDDTRSMQTTDPTKLSAIAINKFVDILSASSNIDVRLGITTYSINVMSNLSLGQTGETIKNFANTVITQNGRGTDAATGLNWAVNELVTKGEDSRNKAIILIGDGENSYVSEGVTVRSDAESNAIRDAAIANAASKNIKVYTLAINPTAENFRQYFSNIAAQTNGKSYEPKTPADLDSVLNDIFSTLTNTEINTEEEVVLPPDTSVTETFEVPDGVFEMILRCSYLNPIEITFEDTDKNLFNKNTKGVKYIEEPTYCVFTISQPVKGEWKVTYSNNSDVTQSITPEFIFHTDLTVSLSKNQTSIMQKQPVEYIATVSNKDAEISDDNSLSGLDAKLVISAIDDKGNKSKPYSEVMKVKSGKLVLDYAIDNPGKYEIYVELVGEKSTIKSNVITIDVAKDPSIIPLWVYIAIAGGVILLIIIVVVIINSLRSKEGSGFIRGFVSIKINARSIGDDSAMFQQDRFDCQQIFSKKNTLSDLISAYVRRYRINNPSELAEMTITQFINSSLSDVTDKIRISGNKKKQTIVVVPALSENEIQLDDAEVSKTKKLVFSSSEKDITLRFVCNGTTYTIYLVFTRE